MNALRYSMKTQAVRLAASYCVWRSCCCCCCCCCSRLVAIDNASIRGNDDEQLVESGGAGCGQLARLITNGLLTSDVTARSMSIRIGFASTFSVLPSVRPAGDDRRCSRHQDGTTEAPDQKQPRHTAPPAKGAARHADGVTSWCLGCRLQ